MHSNLLSFKGIARITLAGLTLLAMLFCVAYAQETTGAIGGTVSDPSGAAVPNAKVEISGGALPRPISLVTDGSGNYLAPQVPAGMYSVTVTATGFSVIKKTEIQVVLGRTTRVEFKMEVGSVSESVVVAADAVLVDTSSSAANTSVERTFFDILPKGRNFDSLIAVAPGARPESKSGGYQLDGASGSENVFYLDGMEVTSIRGGTLSRQGQVPFEFVKEVQIKNGGLEAQYGGAMGGAVNAVLRSGSNELHGQAGLFYAGDGLNAGPRPYIRQNPNSDAIFEYFKPGEDGYRLLNPVINLAGPILPNKLWFFAGYAPEMRKYNRTVKFNSGETGTYEQNQKQDFLVGKVDYAPWSKIRTAFSYLYNPGRSMGSLPSYEGTDSFATPWAVLGNRSAAANYTFQADYIASSKLVISGRGGYNYSNYKDYGIPRGAYIRYLAPTTNAKDASGNPLPVTQPYTTASGIKTTNNQQTVLDKYTRFNLNLDATYIFTALGQHTLKGGWQLNKLANSANASTWPDGYIRVGWGQTYTGVTVPGTYKGTYGYYIDRYFSTAGDVSSNNQGIFLQDTWRVSRRLTLNLGIRTEREFVPSYRTDSGIASRAINFPFSDKLAPRVGFALDPTGQGKMKLYGSWGYFFDIMKYQLPRGSFGGDKWLDYVYTLNTGNLADIKPAIGGAVPTPPSGSKLIEVVDWRIPSNDPSDNTIDPNLKPTKKMQFDLGYEYSLSPTLVGSLRYTHNNLIRTIEDVGTLTPRGEVYYIANPGFGIVADPKTWEPGIPTTPKAKRVYDALELRLDKRFAKNYQFAASYTWSKLRGNYSGLASSDEDGRTDPNVNRYFDLPWLNYNEKGGLVDGPLPTDRPHTLKFFGGYSKSWKGGTTTFSPNYFIYSGIPISSQINVQSTAPMYVYNRGDAGRTPIFQNLDLNVYHDFLPFKNHESWKARFEVTVFNSFNSAAVTNKNNNLINPNDGQLQFDHEADIFKGFNTASLIKSQNKRPNPAYLWGSSFQGPRTMRLQMSFFF